MGSFPDVLSNAELNKVKARGTRRSLAAGELVFSEGDAADYIYFIESGRISIFIEKFNSRQEIQTLGARACFGEMAVFFKDKRTASACALDDSTLLSIRKEAFLELMQAERAIADKINRLLARRNEELVLKEKLIETMGLPSHHLHIGIKGDQSLRETAMSRKRYQSVVDGILPELIPHLEELLLRRCVYRVFIGFNSGEIRISSLMDPFTEEYHPAKRLLDDGYLDRHFSVMNYASKAAMVRSLYATLQERTCFNTMPAGLQAIFGNMYRNWLPVPEQDVARTILNLPALRSIENYYVRNVTISTIRDAIHMQFNCDGAHIVSSDDYAKFLKEYV